MHTFFAAVGRNTEPGGDAFTAAKMVYDGGTHCSGRPTLGMLANVAQDTVGSSHDEWVAACCATWWHDATSLFV
jgi:hypothetical protein